MQPPPPPILEKNELSFDVEHVLTHEVRGSGLNMDLRIVFGKQKYSLRSKVLKEYWDIVERWQEQLTQNKGVKSVSMSSKMDRKGNHKWKQVGGLGV